MFIIGHCKISTNKNFSGFNKRIGSDTTTSLGGRPRSLEQKDDDEISDEKESRSIDVKNVREDNVRNAVDASEGKDEIVNRRRRRHLVDGNGNRILHVVKRDATEMAEVETTEKVIQVRMMLRILFTADVFT